MKRSWLNHVSPKQAAINRQYTLLKNAYLLEHPGCEFKYNPDTFELTHRDDPDGIQCLARFRTTVHHRMGRGIHTLEVEWFMSACQPHHDWAEHNKKKARELGYILYR